MPGGIIAAVTPLISLVAGFVALVTGALILRSFGPRYRVGRLLASTPEITVGEALAHAAGPSRYVRIAGRIDSEHEFEDDAHRPLVFRRTRLATSKQGVKQEQAANRQPAHAPGEPGPTGPAPQTARGLFLGA